MSVEDQDSAIEPMSPAIVDTLVKNHRRFLAFVERRVGDRALAEDLIQDAFVKSRGRLGELPSEEAVVAWFFRVLKNSIVDSMRRRASASRTLAAFAKELESELETTSEPELRAAVCQCVSELATTLKPEYAEALRRIELDGLSVKSYADEAGITAGNAAVRVFRAREALRQRVARSCGTCAEHGCLDCTCERASGQSTPDS